MIHRFRKKISIFIKMDLGPFKIGVGVPGLRPF